MNNICRDIFVAIHEGKWLQIEYQNQENKKTKYWIGIIDIDVVKESLTVEGFHLVHHTTTRFETIYIKSIISTFVLDGTYYPINDKLIQDINLNREKYTKLFSRVPNLKILNYLSDCFKMDSIPYCVDYKLLEKFDNDCIVEGEYQLSDAQFDAIVNDFQQNIKSSRNKLKIKQLGLNVLSIRDKKDRLYILAYKRLHLNPVNRTLHADDEATLCYEFTVNQEVCSITYYLNEADLPLLDDFENNLEIIKDKISSHNSWTTQVDDRPYICALESDITVNLESEYSAILNMYEHDTATVPIRAFFGELTSPIKGNHYPITLVNNQINLDQILAIDNAFVSPLSYVQGPPGTGKTKTILNTLVTAFFNRKTVLFSSYNNHPIDSVVESLNKLKYRGQNIPFPIIRLGNNDKVNEAIEYIRSLREQVREMNIYESTLDKYREQKIDRMEQLTALLKKYTEIVELQERKETAEDLLENSDAGLLTFKVQLQARQITQIDKRLAEIGEISNEEALNLLKDDSDVFQKFLYYTSAKQIKQMENPEYKELNDILDVEDAQLRLREFNAYIGHDENFREFLNIFPIVATTCISSYRLGEPKQYFDLVIMDEASQCNSAVSLISILRGNALMLVGDPQQLKPVILLDKRKNSLLRQKYNVTDEYDYIDKSIYDTFLACDSCSEEVLLSYHYRSNEKIIQFSNKKYYNGKLKVMSNSSEPEPLQLWDVCDNETEIKNTAPQECEQIIKYILNNRDKKIGVITPFVNQRKIINDALLANGINDVTCGTVHAFQGDEKDVIIFSLALTKFTRQSTYDWLKNNKELINVAVSRAKDQLIVVTSLTEMERLHSSQGDDDLYELVQYVRSNGTSRVTSKQVRSRAFGIKPYNANTEAAFFESLNHAMSVIQSTNKKYETKTKVPIVQIVENVEQTRGLFFAEFFDLVVFNKSDKKPILAIELDGKEHFEDSVVKEREIKKQQLCEKYGFQLIRVDNSYARRYYYIKKILQEYFIV